MDVFCIGLTYFMLEDKSLADFANLFAPKDFRNNDKVNLKFIKMDEATSMYPNLSDKTQFWLSRIIEIIDIFIAEFHEREAMSKALSKYIAAFT